MWLSFLWINMIQICSMTTTTRLKFQSLESLTLFIKTILLESYYIDTRTLVLRAQLSEFNQNVARDHFGALLVCQVNA